MPNDDMTAEDFEAHREACVERDKQKKRLAVIRAQLREERESKQKLENDKLLIKLPSSRKQTHLHEGSFLCLRNPNPERLPQTADDSVSGKDLKNKLEVVPNNQKYMFKDFTFTAN